MATNFRPEIGDTPFFLGLAFHNEWQDGKADGRVNSAEVLPASFKNLVNFGPATPEFTVMVWRPYMRQMREIVETRSILGTRIRQRITGTAERICAKCTPHRRRFWSFARTSLNVKVKGQRPRSPGTKNVVHSDHPAVGLLTEWKALVADNVSQAANATSRSLVRGVFAGLRSACGGLPLGSPTHF